MILIENIKSKSLRNVGNAGKTTRCCNSKTGPTLALEEAAS
jgi:hypothetical protein